MLFWILAIGLSLITIALLLRPLLTRSAGGEVAVIGSYDSEVYKDQLQEIERDVEAGTLSEDEAKLARVEISRRLIAVSEPVHQQKIDKAFSFIAVAPMALLFIISSAFVYVLVGNPLIPNQPLAQREAPKEKNVAAQSVPDDIADMVAQAEAHLAQNPDDGRGWDVLAPIYFRVGEFLKAQDAFAKAIALEGSTPNRHSGLGEAIMRAQEGIVTSEAKSNFERAQQLDPDDPRANFFLALALMQSGKDAEAIAAFEDFGRRSPADAPWIDAIKAQIATMKGVSVSEVTIETAQAHPQSQLGNPSAEDIEAAAELNSEDRMAMIASMVASLGEKLKDEPDNFEGWQRLIRSYKVLGRDDDAKEALGTAFKTFASDTDQGKVLVELAKQMQIAMPDGVQ
ncbi:c-type cytochrome biogenesis protein CcmI [Lentilitoribacter sp. Alg239-R112]|uniref:c-type cytochrome biogenesis protein CcmI n=1 Tax=Lentilitoribacter sp. Alg239-R112 TaxID=2305987 RepID=UPI0013A6B278|nr:c-type cytochrome biogenesis protein CcmI [Lentilitoribacter sp. Alg239-R112]